VRDGPLLADANGIADDGALLGDRIGGRDDAETGRSRSETEHEGKGDPTVSFDFANDRPEGQVRARIGAETHPSMSRILLSRLMALMRALRSGVKVPPPPAGVRPEPPPPPVPAPPDELGCRLGAMLDMGLSPARTPWRRPSPRSTVCWWLGVVLVVGGQEFDGPGGSGGGGAGG
jgi:hypothetical protein